MEAMEQASTGISSTVDRAFYDVRACRRDDIKAI